MQIAVCSRDLMALSSIRGEAERRGVSVQAMSDLSAVSADQKLLIVDLLTSNDLPASIAALRREMPDLRIIAFGPHVHEQLLEEASSAGCDQVLTRGQFMKSLSNILQQTS